MPRMARALTAAVLLAGVGSAGVMVLDENERAGATTSAAAIGTGAAAPAKQLAALERSMPQKVKAAAEDRRARQKISQAAHRGLNDSEALAVTRRAFPKLVAQPGFRADRPG